MYSDFCGRSSSRVTEKVRVSSSRMATMVTVSPACQPLRASSRSDTLVMALPPASTMMSPTRSPAFSEQLPALTSMTMAPVVPSEV